MDTMHDWSEQQAMKQQIAESHRDRVLHLAEIKNCHHCGVPIAWVKTANGKNLPIDVAYLRKSAREFVVFEDQVHASRPVPKHDCGPLAELYQRMWSLFHAKDQAFKTLMQARSTAEEYRTHPDVVAFTEAEEAYAAARAGITVEELREKRVRSARMGIGFMSEIEEVGE